MWLLLLIVATMTLAQQDEITVNLRADTTTPRVGEPVTFTLSATYSDYIEILRWPELPDQWGAFEIVERGDVIIEQNEDRVTQRQTFIAFLWQVGDFATPETTLDYRRQGLDETLTTVIPDLFFSVPSTLPTNETPGLQPNRDPIGFNVIPVWLLVIAGGGIGGISVILARAIWKRRQGQTEEPINTPSIDPAQQVNIAVQKALSKQDAIDIHDAQRVFEALWIYLGERFQFEASEASFNETLRQLHDYLPSETFKTFEQVVRRYELLRFSPTADDHQAVFRLIVRVARWFQQIEASDR